jgi:hypothetical protein
VQSVDLSRFFVFAQNWLGLLENSFGLAVYLVLLWQLPSVVPLSLLSFVVRLRLLNVGEQRVHCLVSVGHSVRLLSGVRHLVFRRRGRKQSWAALNFWQGWRFSLFTLKFYFLNSMLYEFDHVFKPVLRLSQHHGQINVIMGINFSQARSCIRGPPSLSANNALDDRFVEQFVLISPFIQSSLLFVTPQWGSFLSFRSVCFFSHNCNE